MKEILSKSIILENTLSLNDMLSLHQFSKNYSGTIYMLGDHRLIKPSNLPKLVSFLLTYKNHEIKIVAEGHNVQQTLTKFQELLRPIKYKKTNRPGTELNSSLKVSF